MRKLCCLFALVGAGAVTGASPTVHAADPPRGADQAYLTAGPGEVASSFEDDDVFDLNFGVGYTYNFKRAAILREWNRGGGDTENRLVKDLIFQQQRHVVTPTLEIGLYHDLSIYFQLPVIVYDQTEYSFDQRADDCVFGDSPDQATCVNKDNSTTLRDEIIPRDGIDATTQGAPFSSFTGPATELIFRGPVRRGIDQFHVGLKYGILNQEKRSHMPNWIVAFEGRFGVGRPMTFNRELIGNDPSGNHRVGRRVHELGLWTALSRRYRFLDPYFLAYWRQAIRGAGSKFQDFSNFGAQDEVQPMSTAGLLVGSEVIPWERKAKNLKVALYLHGLAALNYGGRGYSEVWQLLADSPALAGSYDPTTQAVGPNGMPVDEDIFCNREAALAFARDNPGDPDYLQAGGPSCEKFQGITDIQDYGTFGIHGGLDFHLGRYVRLNLGVNFQTDTRHFVTSAGRGNAQGGVDDDRVEVGTREVNPVRRDVVDNVGRRYMVDDVFDVYAHLRLLLTF